MSGKINSNICLMLSVYKSYHQTLKYGPPKNQIVQELTGLEIQISMKASKTKNWFQTGFQQPKSGLQKRTVLTSLVTTPCKMLSERQMEVSLLEQICS